MTASATDWPDLAYPLGPKPWRIDLEESDKPISIRVVAADGTMAFDLVLSHAPEQLEQQDDERPGYAEAVWEAGLRVAEEITGASRYAEPPRLPSGPHASRFWKALRDARVHQSTVSARETALLVDCDSCGEQPGTDCA